MNKKIRDFLERYLTAKIGVEIKCCLMFFLVLCFYCAFRLIKGRFDADILHMLQMILTAYVMQWVQSIIGCDFDDVDRLGQKEWLLIGAESAGYALVAQIAGWYGENISVVIGFGFYMVAAYLCTFLIYKIKRAIDAKFLNDDLKAFQSREE